MKLISKRGHVVHSPLSFVFQMVRKGGGATQKYSSLDDAFSPDRTRYEYILQPQLMLTDPDGNLPAGEYTQYLKNVLWTLTLNSNGQKVVLSSGGDNFTGGTREDNFIIHVRRNVKTSESLHVEFSADYYDENRGERSHFYWDETLTTMGEDVYKTSLLCERTKTKLRLYPLKRRGEVYFNTQLYNGDEKLDDDISSYHWQKWDWDNNKYVEITEDDLWYVSGKDSKNLIIDQDYVNKVKVHLVAYPTEAPVQKHEMTYFIKRWYGQWEEHVDFTRGKYIFDDTKRIVMEGGVVNRSGEVDRPQKFFDIELFYRKNAKSKWISLGYNGTNYVRRESDADGHECGIVVREKSALQPIELPNGKILCDNNGNPIVANFPIGEREV